nr:SidA/IucD/PvdA family monooxygenase [Sinobaca sp. H24]
MKQVGENKIDSYYAKHVVLGVGNTPIVPGIGRHNQEDIYHTENYSFNKQTLRDAKAVTIIGSGQSAAEVFYDLLQDQKYFDYRLSWFTRSPQFFQAENAKVAREIFS